MSAEEFTKVIGGTISRGFVTVGLAIGTRHGLFKALADLAQSRDAAVTSQQLADSISFKERYVREWINGMVCGGVVDHDEVDGKDRYWLEPYRLPALLGDDFALPALFAELAVLGAQAIPMVEKCYPVSGPNGTDINAYGGVHQFLETRGIKWHTPENCKLIVDDADLQTKLAKGIKVLEMGCGAADPTKALATCFPKSTFIASDISEKVLERAQANCKDLANVSCQVVDACNISEEMHGQFDLVMLFDVYHDVPQPQKLVDGACKLLKSGGQFLMNEVDMHETVTDNKTKKGAEGAVYYTVSSLYCVPTCINTPGGEGLGACGGMELYERRLKQNFSNVEQIGKRFGLYFLCTL